MQHQNLQHQNLQGENLQHQKIQYENLQSENLQGENIHGDEMQAEAWRITQALDLSLDQALLSSYADDEQAEGGQQGKEREDQEDQVGEYTSIDQEENTSIDQGEPPFRGVQVLANSQIFANLYLKFANLIRKAST